jgi:hypothetical protein
MDYIKDIMENEKRYKTVHQTRRVSKYPNEFASPSQLPCIKEMEK